jgi:hypothetical protein
LKFLFIKRTTRGMIPGKAHRLDPLARRGARVAE